MLPRTSSVKRSLRELLMEQGYRELPEVARRDPAVVRKLHSLLFDGDPLVRWRAVLGFGALARETPHAVRRVLSRLAFSLNDEASTCGLGAAPAVGEMAASQPEMAREVVRIVVHYFEDVESCHSTNRNVAILCSALWAVGRVGRVDPVLVGEVHPTLMGFALDPEAEVRGHALWALGEAGVSWDQLARQKGGECLSPLLEDLRPAPVFIPERGEFLEQTVGEWARRLISLHGLSPPS